MSEEKKSGITPSVSSSSSTSFFEPLIPDRPPKRFRWGDVSQIHPSHSTTNEEGLIMGTGTTPSSTSSAVGMTTSRWSRLSMETSTTTNVTGGLATPIMSAAQSTPMMSSSLFSSSTPSMGMLSANSGRRGFGQATPLFSAGMATPSMTVGGSSLFSGISLDSLANATPSMLGMQTPALGAMGTWGSTPSMTVGSMTPQQPYFAQGFTVGNVAALGGDVVPLSIDRRAQQLEREFRRKNSYLTEEELDALLPSEGYQVVPVPASHVNIQSTTEPNFYALAKQELETESKRNGGMESDLLPAGNSTDTFTSYPIPEEMGHGLPRITIRDAGVFEILLKYHNIPAQGIPVQDLSRVLTMQALLKIKNGDGNQRKTGMKYILDKFPMLGANAVFDCIFEIWKARVLTPPELHFFVKLLQRILLQLREAVVPFAKDLLACVQTMLSDAAVVIRDDGRDLIALLSTSVGIRAMYEAINADISDENDSIRRHTAKTIAIMAQALGAEGVLRILRPISSSRNTLARHTAARAIQEMAILSGSAITTIIPEICEILRRLCGGESDNKVLQDSAVALSLVADVCAPYGTEYFEPLIRIVRDHCSHYRNRGRLLTAFLKAFGSLIPIMKPIDAHRNAAEMMPTLLSVFNTPDDELRRVILRVVQQCIVSDSISSAFIRDDLLDPFFRDFWRTRRAATDRRTSILLVTTTVDIAKRIGSAEVLGHLVQLLKEELPEQMQSMAVDTITQVIEACGTFGLAERLIRHLIDAVLSALRMNETGTNRTIFQGFASVVNYLGKECSKDASTIVSVLSERLSQETAEVRAQAGEVISLTARTLHSCGVTPELRRLYSALVRHLNDSEPISVAFFLKALKILGETIAAKDCEPPPQELLSVYLRPLFNNRDPSVQYHLVDLVQSLALSCRDQIEGKSLKDVAMNQLFDLLDNPRRTTRRVCAQAFGTIAYTTGSVLTIVRELTENLHSDERRARICTGVALSTIAANCAPLTVIPFLINEYQRVEGMEVAEKTQAGVLKTLRFLFEEIGSMSRNYVYSVVPLVERALTESSLQIRRMGVEVARALIMSCVGFNGFEDVTIHLLNFVHPNVVELLSKNQTVIVAERFRMICEVVRVYEAARLILGSPAIFQYLIQGLFHPSKKVKDIFWRSYNIIYLANPEAMVPCFPATMVNFPALATIGRKKVCGGGGARSGGAKMSDSDIDDNEEEEKKGRKRDVEDDKELRQNKDINMISVKREELYVIV